MSAESISSGAHAALCRTGSDGSSAMACGTAQPVASLRRAHSAKSSASVGRASAALTARPHWHYLLWRILSGIGVKGAVIEDIAALLAAGTPLTGKQFPAGEHILAGTASGLQILHPDELVKKSSLTVPSVGSYVLDGVAFSVAQESWKVRMNTVQPAGTLIADASKLPFPFKVRHWEDGDWMQPLGAPGRRKLSDLFKDMKWSRAQKAAALVIAQDAHVVAVIGHRIDESLKVTPGTRQILRIRFLGRYGASKSSRKDQ